MRMEVFNNLIKDLYITPQDLLKKSNILHRKARLLKVRGGIAALKDCIHRFSKAIFVMVIYFVLVLLFFLPIPLL